MATTITGITKSKILTNLDTYNHTALSTQMYGVSVQLSEIPPSGITITIKQNSSTIASTVAPANGQSTVQLQCLMNCTANDVIGVILASSSAVDAQLNDFKAILRITAGQRP